MNLETWIPELAKTTGKPAMLVHLKAQQIAKASGIVWGVDMADNDVAALREAVAQFYGVVNV